MEQAIIASMKFRTSTIPLKSLPESVKLFGI